MPSYMQSSFIGGEWAPEYHARTDQELYRHALALCRNFIVLPAGGVTYRSGTVRTAAAKSSAASLGKVRLERFSPAANVNFTLEFGALYVRFYRKRLQVPFMGGVYEIATPYAVGDLAGLSLTRDGGTLWLWHPNYATRQLIYGGTDTGWTFTTAPFTDGPYLDATLGTTTATPSAAAGSATIALNNTTEVNAGDGFQASDVGRPVRFLCPTYELTQFVSLGSGGATYHVGDTVEPAGGTALATSPTESRTALLTVTATNPATGGAITGGTITDKGQYIVAPSTSFTQGATSGIGSGLTGTVGYTQTGEAIWIWGVISAVADTTHATVDIKPLPIDAIGTTQTGQFLSTAAITKWRLGAWCATQGFPAAGGRFQRRLVAGGTVKQPKRIFASETDSQGLSHAPSLANQQVIASNAFAFDLDAEEAGAITAISGAGSAQLPQLAVLSGDTEFILQPAVSGAALSPTNVQIYAESHYGAAAALPLRIGRLLLLIEKSLQRLRKWMYQWQAGGFVGPEAAPNGQHLLRGGLLKIDYALTPFPIVWGATQDGQLIGMTFQADEDAAHNIEAWHSHPLGGSYYGGPAIVESLAVSRSEDGVYDELWLSVLRNDNGVTSRTIEVQAPPFRSAPGTGPPQLSGAVFLDMAANSGLTSPAATCIPNFVPVTANGATRRLPIRGDSMLVSFDADVAAAGDQSPGTVLRINSGTFRLTAYTDARNIVAQCMDPPVSLTPQPSGAWTYTKMKTSFTGFAAYNGYTVQVLGDGGDQGSQVVAGGTIVTADPVSYILFGLLYPGLLETLDLDMPAPDGTSQMKAGDIDHLYLRFLDSLGGEYGPAPDSEHPNPKLDKIDERSTADLLNWPPALISDDRRVAFPGGSSMHRRVRIRQSHPWPMTVLGLVVKSGTREVRPR